MKQSTKLIREIDEFTDKVHTYLKESNNLQCWRKLMLLSRELNDNIKKEKIKDKPKKIPLTTYILSTLCILSFISGLIHEIGFVIGFVFLMNIIWFIAFILTIFVIFLVGTWI